MRNCTFESKKSKIMKRCTRETYDPNRDKIVRLYGLRILTNITEMPLVRPKYVSEAEWECATKENEDGKKLFDISFGELEDDGMAPMTIIVHNTYAGIAYTMTVKPQKASGKIGPNTRNSWWRNCHPIGAFGTLSVSTRPNQCDNRTKFTIRVPRSFVRHPFIEDSLKTGNVCYIFEVLTILFKRIVDSVLTETALAYLDRGAYACRSSSIDPFKKSIEDAVRDEIDEIVDSLDDDDFQSAIADRYAAFVSDFE